MYAEVLFSSPLKQVVSEFHTFYQGHRLYEHNGFCVSVWEKDGELVLGHISLPLNQRGCGEGSAILKWLTDRADEHGLVIHVEPGTTKDGRRWYIHHGFFPIGEMGDGGPVWKRRPKTPGLELTPARLRLLILEEVTRFRLRRKVWPEDIQGSNFGRQFARRIVERAEAEHVLSEGDKAPEMAPIEESSLYVIKYQGLMYDPECPEGTTNPLHIPAWARVLGKDEDLEPRYLPAEIQI
jgi:hypothetical protein